MPTLKLRFDKALGLLFYVGQTSPTTVSRRPPQWPYARMRTHDGSTDRCVVAIEANGMALLKNLPEEVCVQECVLLLAFSHHSALTVGVGSSVAAHPAWLQC